MLGLIDNLGFGEFMIVAIVSLLVFGKRLPEVAGRAGAQLARLRRSLDTLWRETGVAREIRSVQNELHGVVPRDLSIGDMARMASADIQRSLREVEQEASTVSHTSPENASAPVAPNVSSSTTAPTSASASPGAHDAENPPPAVR